MKILRIVCLCFFAVAVSGCTIWGWIYGAKKSLKNEDFSFYDPYFEYNNLKKLKTTKSRFDGFYYKKSSFPDHNKTSRISENSLEMEELMRA